MERPSRSTAQGQALFTSHSSIRPDDSTMTRTHFTNTHSPSHARHNSVPYVSTRSSDRGYQTPSSRGLAKLTLVEKLEKEHLQNYLVLYDLRKDLLAEHIHPVETE
jgi:hypothetical protein